MKKYILLIVFLLAFVFTKQVSAQNSFSSPLDIGTKDAAFTYTDTKNTNNYTNSYGRTTKDVIYRFTISRAMDVVISHCGSEVLDTYVYLLVNESYLYASNDNYSGEGSCPSTTNSYLKTYLTPGTYYVVSEGYSQNGNITTMIKGTPPRAEFDIGQKGSSFIYTDTKNTNFYSDSYQFFGKNDVFYKLNLTTKMDLLISHCGSEVLNTCLYLLDQNGNQVAYSLDNGTDKICSNQYQAYLEIPDLAAGIYYIVTEGRYSNGNITTSVQGIRNINGSELKRNTNYVHTRTMTGESDSNYNDEYQYFDGLGRPIEHVQYTINPSYWDLVTLQEYDEFGRESNAWLPYAYAYNMGAFVSPDLIKSSGAKSTNGGDEKPYSRIVYENSPLNRVIEKYGPGQDWHKTYGSDSKAVRIEYTTNTTSGVLSCIQYNCGTGVDLILTKKGIYAANELYVTKETDENNNISYEFKDKQGLVILTRQINDNIQHDTYYIYDDFGMLKAVLPPLATDMVNTDVAQLNPGSLVRNSLAYLYTYDNRNRCISKKIPGCEPVYYIYDKADRLIFTQDGEQRNGKNEWTFTIPDAFGRIVLTGTCTNSLTYATDPLKNMSVKATYTGGTNLNKGYTISGITLTSSKILQVNYYDNYNFLNTNGISEGSFNTESGYGESYTASARGLQTGTLTAQMKSDGTIDPTYLYSVMYYDNRGRLVQTKSNNHLTGGLEKEYIAYNFTGQPTQKKHVHSATGKNTQTEVYAYTYDHAGRLLKTTHQLTDGTTVKPQVTLAENSYDELGRLKTNKKNNQANLTTSYAYNVRSWTKSISSPLFNQTLYYNESYGGSTKQYNGNITAISWKHSDETATRGYTFAYDNLSRLTTAIYLQNTTANNNYKSSYTYDKHGNMTTLQRYGLTAASTYGIIDNLTMSYAGNQLTKAEDAVATISLAESADFKNYSNTTTEYTYNKNGAMTKDLNKGISAIAYNSLNLPRQMDIKSPIGEGRNQYTYSAGGQKLKAIQKWNPNYSTAPVIGSNITESTLTKTETTDYVGNIIYESRSDGTSKTRILIDGGYIENNAYHFYLNDHLGNNRVVANASGTVTQKNHYYPFGTTFAESTNRANQPYKYNGKELDQLHGLNLYDYSARYYESAIGRFTTIDPKAESYPWNSPYMYAGNNPILNFDPDGEDYWSTNDPELIKQFLNSAGRVAKYYDFTGWDHATDTQFTSSLTYNDETGKYHMSYATVINGEITVIGKSFDANLKPVSLTGRGYSGAFVYDYAGGNGGLYQSAYNAAQYMELSSFATTLMSPFDPNSYYDGVSNWNVDGTGRLVGINNVQLAKKGGVGKALAKIFIKGFGNVSQDLFHRTIKPNIIKAAGGKSYLNGIVGHNPNVTIVNGKIVLQGTKDSPFRGIVHNTGLNANDFLQ